VGSWSRNERFDRLAGVPLLAQCSPSELREISRLGTEIEVEAGSELTREGEPGSEFFLVVEGEADCSVRGKTAAVFGPDDFFGELALIDGGSRTATVKALTRLRLTVLNRSEFSTLLRASPTIAIKMLRNLARRLRDTQAAVC
jgi:CRP/FNR family transcriptional regulator, cyclic AMP receptor protein